MASVDKQESSKNEYRDNNTFSSGYGVANHTRVTSLAENGRYITAEKADENVGQTGSSLKQAYFKMQSAENIMKRKEHTSHYDNETYMPSEKESDSSQAYISQDTYHESIGISDSTHSGYSQTSDHQKKEEDIKAEFKRQSFAENVRKQNDERQRQENDEIRENDAHYRAELAADLKEQLERDIIISEAAKNANGKKDKRLETASNTDDTAGAMASAVKEAVHNIADKVASADRQNREYNKYLSIHGGENDEENDEENIKEYYSSKRQKARKRYEKKVYKAYRRVEKISDNSNKPSLLRRVSEINKEIIKPLSEGNAVKALSAPAKIYLRNLLRKHRLGRMALDGREIIKKTSEAASNAADMSEAMAASGQTAVKETVRIIADNAASAVYRRHEHNKYLSRLDSALKRADQKEKNEREKLDDTLEKLSEEEAAAMSGGYRQGTANNNKYFSADKKNDRTVSGTAANKYLFEEKGNANNKYIAGQDISKQSAKENNTQNIKRETGKKNFIKNKRKELSDKKQNQNEKKAANQKTQSKIISHTKRIIQKKFSVKAAAICFSGASSVVIVIIVIIIIIAILFSWLDSYKYVLAGKKDETKASTDAEILEGYLLEIQNYMDVACTQTYQSYGTYCSSHYNWEAAQLDWGEYYNEILKPQIDAAIKAIQDNFSKTLSGMKKPDPSYVSSLAKQMTEEINRTVAKIVEEGKKEFDETLEKLNDGMGDPEQLDLVKHFNPPENSETEHTETGGSKNGVWDVSEYNGKTCEGTNGFDLQSLNFDTDLTAEDIFQYVALSRTLKILNDENGSEESETVTSVTTETSATTAPPSESTSDSESVTADSEEDDSFFGEITPKELNTFFKKTKLINIEAHLDKGQCCGKCQRKLEGNWHSGFTWKYFCNEHSILSGSISIKNKDELLEAVMTEYNAEGAGMTEEDCKDFLKTYEDYLDDNLGENSEKHYFGKKDLSRSVSFYNALMAGKEVPNFGIWNIECPFETDESKKEEEKSDDKTDKKT